MIFKNRISSQRPRALGGLRFSVAAVAKTFGRSAPAFLRLGDFGHKPLSGAGRRGGRAQPDRRGVTAVEFAMTAPILFLMLYVALELGHANMTFNAVEAACYEGARIGIVPGAQAADCQAAAQRILSISKIRGASVSRFASLSPMPPRLSCQPPLLGC